MDGMWWDVSMKKKEMCVFYVFRSVKCHGNCI